MPSRRGFSLFGRIGRLGLFMGEYVSGLSGLIGVGGPPPNWSKPKCVTSSFG